MTKGLKIWLWVILVINILGVVLSVSTVLVSSMAWVSLILEIGIIAGLLLLLFRQKRLGFYLICIAAVAGLVINVLLGHGLIDSLISAVLMPMITWLFLKGCWEQFE